MRIKGILWMLLALLLVLKVSMCIRNLQEEIGPKKMEDIEQKKQEHLENKRQVIFRRPPFSRKFSELDFYHYFLATQLAQKINGKAIFERVKTNTTNQISDSKIESTLKFRSLSTIQNSSFDYGTVSAKQLIKKEKEVLKNQLRNLQSKLQTQDLFKNPKISDSLNSSKLEKQKQSHEIPNDGFPIADSQMVQKQTNKNRTVENIQFCIVVPSFNNGKNELYKRNVNSIFQQEYINYHVVYVDDKSEDNTTENLITYLKEMFNESYQEVQKNNDFSNILSLDSSEKDQNISEYLFNEIKWTFIQKTSRKYALQNIYNSIHNHCSDNEIALIIDGDDALIGTQVLSFLNSSYKLANSLFIYTQYLYKKQILLTETYTLPDEWSKLSTFLRVNNETIQMYPREWVNKTKRYQVNKVTSYEKGPAGMEVPLNALAAKKFRDSQSLLASHLLTFYVSLFKKIPLSNFIDENQQFFKYAYDRALTLPLAELAPAWTLFLQYPLYEYNANTGINDSPQNWAAASLKIRQKPPLDSLTDSQVQSMHNKVLKY